MAFPPKDVETVRSLAERLAEVAALPIQETNRRMWRDLNSLRPVRPMVWINELPWSELAPDIPLACTDEFCRRHEAALRRTLYLWEHMRCDMVVDGVVYSPYVFHNSGFGLKQHAVAPTEAFASETTRWPANSSTASSRSRKGGLSTYGARRGIFWSAGGGSLNSTPTCTSARSSSIAASRA